MAQTADEITSELVAVLLDHAGQIPERDYYAALEAIQSHLDYYDKLIDNGLPSCNTDIYVKVDGTTIRFKELDQFAQWIQEAMHR